MAKLSSSFAASYDLGGTLRFSFAFLVLWWAWLGHTFHASRFDEDRADQRALGMAQILAVVLIGYCAEDAFGARGGAFAAGMASFKVLLESPRLFRRPVSLSRAGMADSSCWR
jgi:low temperature requirement protein LtrA